MIIANIDTFKAWVQKKVSSITDADPATLARYVAALVKKDRPESDLREVCLQELNIFLLDHTKSFVELLFSALTTQSYLTDQVAPDSTVADSAPVKQLPVLSTRSGNVPLHRSPGDGVERGPDWERRPSSRSRQNSNPGDGLRSRRSKSSSRDGGSRTSASQRLYSTSHHDRLSPVFSRLGYRQRSPDRLRRDSPPRRRASRDHEHSSRDRDRTSRDRDRSVRDRLGYRTSSISNRRSTRDSDRQRVRSRSRSPRDIDRRLRERSRTRSPRSRMRSDDLGHRSRRRSLARSPSRSPRRSPHRSYVRSSPPHPPVRSPVGSPPQQVIRSPPRSPSAPKSPPQVISVVSSIVRTNSKEDELLGDFDKSPSSDGRDESDYRITVPLDTMNDIIGRPPPDLVAVHWPPVRPRCRDFDDKGFCIRGDLCPFDHGIDPVVVDDVLLPPPLAFQASIPPHCVVATQAPVHVTSLVQQPTVCSTSIQRQQMNSSVLSQSTQLTQFTPTVGSLPNINQPPPMFVSGGLAPAAVSVKSVVASRPLPVYQQQPPQTYRQQLSMLQAPPIMHKAPPSSMHRIPPPGSLLMSPAFRPRHSYHIARHLLPPNIAGALLPATDGRLVVDSRASTAAQNRNIFDHSRLGARVAAEPMSFEVESASLIVDNIPVELNTISNINEHFSQFGTVVNVQVCYQGEPERTLVTYSSNFEAAKAYNSNEPVLNNRFITVDWLPVGNNSTDLEPVVEVEDFVETPRTSAKERLGLPIESAHTGMSVHDRLGAMPVTYNPSLQLPDSKTVVLTSGVTRTVVNRNQFMAPRMSTAVLATRNPAAAAASKNYSSTQSRMKLESRTSLQKDATKMQLELLRQKQTLMTKQIEKQKNLLALIESPSLNPADKASALKMLKSLAASVDKLKTELSSTSVQSQKQQQQQQQQQEDQSTTTSSKQQPVTTESSTSVSSNTALKPTETTSLSVSLVKDDPLKAKKFVLDAELELIAKQNKGDSDTNELDRRVSVLKYQASSLGLFSVPPPVHRGKAPSSWSRGARSLRSKWYAVQPTTTTHSHSSSTIDRRPKEIVVTKFTDNEMSAVVTHFRVFGGIPSSLEPDSNNSTEPRIVFSFKTRQQAEIAMSQAANFNGNQLSMTWHQTTAAAAATQPWTGSQHQSSQPATATAAVTAEADTDQQVVDVQMSGAEAEEDEADALIVEQSENKEYNMYEIDSGNELDEDALLGSD